LFNIYSLSVAPNLSIRTHWNKAHDDYIESRKNRKYLVGESGYETLTSNNNMLISSKQAHFADG